MGPVMSRGVHHIHMINCRLSERGRGDGPWRHGSSQAAHVSLHTKRPSTADINVFQIAACVRGDILIFRREIAFTEVLIMGMRRSAMQWESSAQMWLGSRLCLQGARVSYSFPPLQEISPLSIINYTATWFISIKQVVFSSFSSIIFVYDHSRTFIHQRLYLPAHVDNIDSPTACLIVIRSSSAAFILTLTTPPSPLPHFKGLSIRALERGICRDDHNTHSERGGPLSRFKITFVVERVQKKNRSLCRLTGDNNDDVMNLIDSVMD